MDAILMVSWYPAEFISTDCKRALLPDTQDDDSQVDIEILI